MRILSVNGRKPVEILIETEFKRLVISLGFNDNFFVVICFENDKGATEIEIN